MRRVACSVELSHNRIGSKIITTPKKPTNIFNTTKKITTFTKTATTTTKRTTTNHHLRKNCPPF